MFFYTTLMLMEVLCIYRGRPHIILYTILMSMELTLTINFNVDWQKNDS